MKKSRKKRRIQEVCWGAVTMIICLILLVTAGMNIRSLQMKFTELPYSVQGYPQGDVLLAGSSFMEYWKTSEADLGPVHTVNVGVGGTETEHWRNHFSELIEPFHPKAIVVYVGSNDIDGSKNSKSGETVARELELFFDQITSSLPETMIYYISIVPTPKRWNVWDEAKKCNQLVSELAEERDELTFIDCTPVLLDENGKPRKEIFRSDDLHFNEKGYELWTSVIRPVISADFEGKEPQ